MAPRVVIVGVGRHGGQIGRMLVEDGYAVVGAVDPTHAGKPLREVLGAGSADVRIAADVPSMLAGLRAGVPADVAIVTAPVGLEGLQTLCFALFDAGLDVLTLQPDAFDPPADWAAAVDARARATGTSFLSTGVQDVWWVHLPAVAAGSVRRLQSVHIEEVVDLGALWAGLGRLLGVGRPAADFPQLRDEVLGTKPPAMASALRVLARQLGLTPGDEQHRLSPVVAEQPRAWATAGSTVAAGLLVGVTEGVTLHTAEGVRLTGSMRTSLLAPDEVPRDRVVLHGDPVLHLEHSPFPGDRVTGVIPVARVLDIVAAPPGLHTAATLPAPRYRHAIDAAAQAPRP